MAEGISIRLTHTGLSEGSIFIDDLREGQDRQSLHRNEGPSYVPVGGSIELTYSGLTAISLERGGIRKFVDGGYLTVEFILSPEFLAAIPATAPLAHATTHERSGSDPIDGDHLGIDFTPTTYTPDDSIAEADDPDDLAAHLKGIDTALGAGGFGDNYRILQMNRHLNVPSNSVLYLSNGDVPTSSAPLVFRSNGQLIGATISVNTADSARDFALRLLINGAIQESLTLNAGNTSAVTSGFTTAISSGDEISAYLERVGGPISKSDFDGISVMVSFSE